MALIPAALLGIALFLFLLGLERIVEMTAPQEAAHHVVSGSARQI